MSFYSHSFRYFIFSLTSEMNLQHYPQFLVCPEGLQAFFTFLYLLFLTES